MFTGIVETTATVLDAVRDGGNLDLRLEVQLDEVLKVDQSVAHNGVCLTVTKVEAGPEGLQRYTVTAVDETLRRTHIGDLGAGDKVNIERCLRAGQRLDGHFVQGHVDARGKVLAVEPADGSRVLRIGFPAEYAGLLVQKGSICVDGVSLTVIDCGRDWFSLTLIPYTWEHTNLHRLRPGDGVNLEFDILGKYMLRQMELKEE